MMDAFLDKHDGIMKEYVHLDFGSVDKRYVRDIAETCLIFQSFSFSNQYLEERSVVALCGRGLGNPRIAHLTYHLSKIKNGITAGAISSGTPILYPKL